ncbi:MAG: urea ABC transporter permease subunit UrtB, partial [Acetobacteraceae bacterium]|nr:urea ABC transporter permease subunit UrtB [Acetobacteraceae bacterium]
MVGLIRAVLLLFAVALPAAAQEQPQEAFDSAVSGLGGGFNQQAEAVERLGALGDPRAVPLLRALAEGRLLKRPDGNGVVPPDEAAPPGAEPARVN